MSGRKAPSAGWRPRARIKKPARPAAGAVRRIAFRQVREFPIRVKLNCMGTEALVGLGLQFQNSKPMGVIPGRATDLGFTRDRRLDCPSRLQPTWVARARNPYSLSVVMDSGLPRYARVPE